MDYSVGQVSRIAKVTVRALHHYDQIALLSPSGRTAAGYRRYGEEDLDRLQRILFYRELGFSLEEIASILDERDGTPAEHLRRQHGLVLERIDRLQAMAVAIERTLEARKMGINLTPEEKFEVFGEGYTDYEDEAAQRWGETEEWRLSQRRAAKYTKDDWVRIKAEADALDARIGAAIAAGAAADGEQAMDIAEAHRLHITGYFYECTYKMHSNLAEMYISDERFTAYYEQIVPGGAVWIREAILANARRAGEGE